ncbi:Putative ankyrin repeat protein [Cladobotryum mycophilum]|uniref:Ankyrin repeat protein n=1 Tax=Cladobotryum mycophilum TaxID=491253 RepID=A0ABR0SR17_9HYPO
MSLTDSIKSREDGWTRTGARRQTATSDGMNNESEDDQRGYPSKLQHSDYSIAWVCALSCEMAAARAMLDKVHETLPTDEKDSNSYTLGSIGMHNVVIAGLPESQYGPIEAAVVASNLTRSFPNIRAGLIVGIGGGVPGNTPQADLRLGDIVVGSRVMQYDLGKLIPGGQLRRTGIMRLPQTIMLTAVTKLRSIHDTSQSMIPSVLREIREGHIEMSEYDYPDPPNDFLFSASCRHEISGSGCDGCDISQLVERYTRRNHDPKIYYGGIGSSSQVMRDAVARDNVARELDIICFEMEAAGLMGGMPYLPVRGICDYADSHKNKRWQKYAAMTAAAYAKELLMLAMPVALRDDVAAVRVEKVFGLSRVEIKREALIESLNFKEAGSRLQTIKNACFETCLWLLEDPVYISWQTPANLIQHGGLLWISGKPGVGKSTIMKFAYLMAEQESPAEACTASFFFNARGHYLERSAIGMHRSLLFQLLQQLPDLQWVLDKGNITFPIKELELSIDAVRELFRYAVLGLEGRIFTCFIDALDECDEQQIRDMIDFFEDLGKQSARCGIQFRVCFSSRHYPYVFVRDGLRLTLEDQQGHKTDIETYVKSRLQLDRGALFDNIKTKIVDKSSGVFMWVVLAVGILNKELQYGELPRIETRMKELPEQLGDLFKDVLGRDKQNMDTLLLCIQLILFARRPLEPEEFYFIISSGLYGETTLQCDAIEPSKDSMCRFVINYTKGLAEVTESGSGTVQFIHESIRDFLIKENGIRKLWPSATQGVYLDSFSHDQLKKCCYAHLKFALKMLPAGGAAGSVLAKTLEYTTRGVFYHADLAAKDISQDEFLSTFPLTGWIALSNLNHYGSGKYPQSASFIYALAREGASNLVRAWLRRNPRVDYPGEIHGYPLIATARRGDTETARILVRHLKYVTSLRRRKESHSSSQIDMKEKSQGRTALSHAVQNRHAELVELLIEAGADLESEDYAGQTALSIATDGGLLFGPRKRALSIQQRIAAGPEIVQQLIEAGAEIDSRDHYQRTPLILAVEIGTTEVVALLVDAGANVEAKDRFGRTALSCAMEKVEPAYAHLLIDAGADIESKDNFGRTPLSYAVCSRRQSPIQRDSSIAKLLIRAGADVNTEDFTGRTPLHWAVLCQGAGTITWLLESGAKIDAKDHSGRTALSYCIEQSASLGIGSSVELLINHGAEVNSTDVSGRTPLSWAASAVYNNRVGQKSLVKSLLEAGANPQIRDTKGHTALGWAITSGNESAIRHLTNWDKKLSDSSSALPNHDSSDYL